MTSTAKDQTLQFPNKLYGREAELERLLNIYETFCASLERPIATQDVPDRSGFGDEECDEEEKAKDSPRSSLQNPGEESAPIPEALDISESAEKVSNVVLLCGKPGSGKSALISKFIEEIQANQNKCHILHGKCTSAGDSISGLGEVFDRFCEELASRDDSADERAGLVAAIEEAIGIEGCRLLTCTMMPNLQQLLVLPPEEAQKTPSTPVASSNEGRYEQTRLNFVFQNFCKALATYTKYPLVIVLNDLQRIDDPSLDLVMDLGRDSSSQVLVLGGLTTATDDTPHHVQQRISVLSTLEQIQLADISQDCIRSFVADTLHLEEQQVAPLADVVFCKTKGNMFFVRQLLKHLHLQEALSCASTTDTAATSELSTWTWDLQQVEAATGLSENLAELVTLRIRRLDERLQWALTCAAYMRSTFDLNTLYEWIKCEDIAVQDEHELYRLLESAVLEDLLRNSVGSREFQFFNDHIQDACYDRIPTGQERNSFLLRLSQFLIRRGRSQEEGEDWMLFVAADNLNFLSNPALEDPLELVTLNVQVGEKAAQASSFASAWKYFDTALRLLMSVVPAPWETHYDLTLRLYHAAANVELSAGDFAKGKAFSDAILEHAQSLHEKLRVQLWLANSLGRQERHTEAMEVHQEALQAINEFPKNFYYAHILRDFRRIKKNFQKYTDYEILLLPVMTNEDKIIAMEHLSQLSLRAFYCNEMNIVFLCVLRQLRLSFKYGICPETAEALAAYGTILCGSLDEMNIGVRVARLSKLLLDTYAKEFAGNWPRSESKMCRVLFLNAVYMDAWAKPISDVLVQLQHAHSRGMEAGDLESAYRSWAISNVHAFVSGFNLHQIRHDGRNLIEQMKQYSVDAVIVSYLPFRELVLHLMGAAATPIDWKSLERAPSSLPTENFRWRWVYWSYLQLAYYFGEYEVAEQLMVPLKEVSEIDTSYVMTSVRIFFSGLTASALAKKTGGKAKYKKQAKKLAAQMKNITRSRGLNNLHKHLLMEADLEAASDTRNWDRVQDQYDRAIAYAKKAGVMQDAALGNELAAEYFANLHFEKQTKQYVTEAFRLYAEWGAKVKVARILQLQSEFIDLPADDPLWMTARSLIRSCEISAQFQSSNKRRNSDSISALTWDEGSARDYCIVGPEVGSTNRRRNSYFSRLSSSGMFDSVMEEDNNNQHMSNAKSEGSSKPSLPISITKRLQFMFPSATRNEFFTQAAGSSSNLIANSNSKSVSRDSYSESTTPNDQSARFSA